MKTTKSYLLKNKIIHLTVFASQLFFLFVVFFLLSTNKDRQVDLALSKTMLPVVAIATILSYFIGNFMFKRLIKNSVACEPLSEKLNSYFSVLIIRYSFLEVPSLFATIIYYLTGNFTFVYFTLLIAVMFLMYNPTKDKIIFDLKLNRENQEILNNPDATF